MGQRLTIARALQRYGVYGLLFMLPISKAAIEILFVVLFAAWLLEHLPTGWKASFWRSRGSRWILITLLGYLAVCGLSIVTSTYPALSLQGFINKTLEYALLFMVAADVVQAPDVAERGLAIMVVSAGVVGLDGVAQELLGRDLLLGHTKTIYQRMAGPFENPSDLATYLAVVVPLILVQMQGAASPRRRGLLWGVLVLVVGCLIRTISVGAWMSLFLAMGLLALRRPTLRRPVALIGATVILGGIVALQACQRLPQLLRFSTVGSQDRAFMWQAAWRMIQDRPLFGQGLNTFMANYLKYWVGGEQQPRYAHNCFLQVAAETGIIGLMTFLMFLGVTLRRWWCSGRAGSATEPRPALRVALAAGLVGFLVQSAFDTNLYALRQAALFWTLAGIATGLSVQAVGRPNDAFRAS